MANYLYCLIYIFLSSSSCNMSSGIGISSPGFEIPGYLQALIIFLKSFTSLYINQISPGALLGFCLKSFSLPRDGSFCCHFTGFVFITAVVPGTIPCSFLSGFRKIPNNFCFDSPYCLILILECSVQKSFLYAGFTNFTMWRMWRA